MSTEAPTTSARFRCLPAAASLLVFTLAIVALHRLAGEFHLADVRSAFHAIPASAFGIAALFAAARSAA